MKRIVFGVLWFLFLSFAGVVVGSAIAGAVAGSKVTAGSTSEGYAKGQHAGQAAGAEFGQKYTGVILLGALVVSVAGTITGILPGTRKKSSK